jgi:glycerol-3-phosphate dehydrogenase
MSKPEISASETRYLCEMASEYFREPVTLDDVVWTYSGVRPLYDDGASKAQEATRDYVIRTDDKLGDGTLINIFGGKITTYRKLAEAILEDVGGLLGARGTSWTGTAPLPGGDFDVKGIATLESDLARKYPFVPAELLHRLVRHYGTETLQLLGNAAKFEDLGRDFGAGLHACEVRYLMANEWAREAEDIAFRRTKLGIRMTAKQIAALADWMAEKAG